MRFHEIAEARLMEVEARPDAAGVYLSVLRVRGDPMCIDAERVDRSVADAVARARARALDADRVRVVRDLLKHGRYRATGRGKPAHEFLHRAASEDRFPRVFGVVDLLNAASLRHELPMSLIDLDAAGTERFILRRGREGERYVFNAADQAIDLLDLLLLATADDDAPCANPVKDSLKTKLQPSSSRLGAVAYGPVSRAREVDAAMADLAEAIDAAWPGAEVVRGAFSPAPGPQ